MIKKFSTTIMTLSVYKEIQKTPIIQSIKKLFNEIEKEACNLDAVLEEYTNIYFLLKQNGYMSLGEFILDFLLYEETAYSVAVCNNIKGEELESAAKRDIETLNILSNISCDKIKKEIIKKFSYEYIDIINKLPNWEYGTFFDLEKVKKHYQVNGYGVFSKYRAFVWDQTELVPVKNFKNLSAEEFIGYDWQRNEVILNTKSLISGERVNNVLLFGDSGTGKSETVKMLVNIPEFYNLRIIEVSKAELGSISKLLKMIVNMPQKFIIFIDDLSFEKSDKDFSILKAALEGGLEKRGKNVAIYATSNRRNMVREFFSERSQDEINTNETIQEKTSLSDRFGIRIPYFALNKDEFLKTVEILAKKAGLSIEIEALFSEAMKWELRHPGRTPRGANQFIDYIKAFQNNLELRQIKR